MKKNSIIKKLMPLLIIALSFNLISWDCSNDKKADLLDAPQGIVSTAGGGSNGGVTGTGSTPSLTYTVIGTYSSPDSNPGGLCYDGSNVWLQGCSNKVFYKYNPSNGQLLSQISVNLTIDNGSTYWVGRTYGLTYYNGSLYSLSTDTSAIHQINPSTGAIIMNITRSNFISFGITYYNGYFWMVTGTSYNPNKIYKIDLSGNTVLTYSTTTVLHDICFGNGSLWVIYEDGTNFYETASIKRIDPVSMSITGTLNTPGKKCTGITYDGTYFWITDLTLGKLYKLKINE